MRFLVIHSGMVIRLVAVALLASLVSGCGATRYLGDPYAATFFAKLNEAAQGHRVVVHLTDGTALTGTGLLAKRDIVYFEESKGKAAHRVSTCLVSSVRIISQRGRIPVGGVLLAGGIGVALTAQGQDTYGGAFGRLYAGLGMAGAGILGMLLGGIAAPPDQVAIMPVCTESHIMPLERARSAPPLKANR